MTINERIRYLRKDHLKMNQTEFAVLIGMKQTSVSSFEKPGATVTDQTIKGICLSVEGLNEQWVRYGTDPMIIEPDTFSLNDFVIKHGMTNVELEIVKTYFELDSNIRKMLLEHFKKGLSHDNTSSDVPDDPKELENQFPPVEDSDSEVG